MLMVGCESKVGGIPISHPAMLKRKGFEKHLVEESSRGGGGGAASCKVRTSVIL